MPKNVLLMDSQIAVVGGASLGCDETLQGLFEGQRLFLTQNQLLMRFCPNLGGNTFGDFPVNSSGGPDNCNVIDLELNIPELGIRPLNKSHEPTSELTLLATLPEDNDRNFGSPISFAERRELDWGAELAGVAKQYYTAVPTGKVI